MNTWSQQFDWLDDQEQSIHDFENIVDINTINMNISEWIERSADI